jgi:hypothetical protein
LVDSSYHAEETVGGEEEDVGGPKADVDELFGCEFFVEGDGFA